MRRVSLTISVTLAFLFVSPIFGADQSPAKPQQDATIHELLAKLADGFGRADRRRRWASWSMAACAPT